MASSPKKPNKRHLARGFAVQALYQWHHTDETPEMLANEFIIDHADATDDIKAIDLDYFKKLLIGTLNHIEAIDEKMTPYLSRPFSQLNPVELAVLRLATYELTYHPEVPFAVVINEAIELAKEFASVEGYKFVNAVLNAMVKNPKQ